jgi:hypothetical protein
MVQAGRAALARYNSEFESSSDAVVRIFLAMADRS